MSAPRPLLALALVLGACSDPAPSAASGATGLVLVSLDTCRADRLSCYGAARPNTPHLDRLAAESVRFSDCLAQSCVTAPSHMSLLTSHYVHRHGLERNGLQSDPPYTLASTLRAAGWRTAAFTGHGSFQAQYGLAEGFETFESWGPGPEAWPFTRDVQEVLPSALAWLEGLAPGAPFFLLVHGYDPHCPYWPDEPARERYAGWYRGPLRPERLCGPPEFLRQIQRGHIGPDELRYLGDLYDAEVSEADRALGGFLDELRRRGLLERSIVVFTSDHGEDLGARDRIGHGALTPGILSVPLIVRFPGGRWSGVCDAPVEGVDLMPTLLAALGVPAPRGLQGRDLMPLVRGEGTPWKGERLRIAGVNHKFSLRQGTRWKLDFGLDAARPTDAHLYDLEADPGAERDLIETAEGRARFDALVGPFLEWRARTQPEDAALYGAAADLSDEERSVLEALGYTENDGG